MKLELNERKGQGRMNRIKKDVIVKVLLGCLVVALFPFTLTGYGAEPAQVVEEEYQVIPDEAIRLRILANSDQDEDQDVKRKVRDAVNANITEWVQDLTDIQEAYSLIDERLPEIEQIVEEVLEDEGVSPTYNVKFGEVEFPTKLYGNYIYPAGMYEAILITLGEGKGANWWCVLFPPLCFLDFSNGTSVAHAEENTDASGQPVENEENPQESEEEEVKVSFFLIDWITSLFS